MKPSSAKQKGRLAQQQVRDALLNILRLFGLENDDIKSTPMGSSGVDIQLSPAAKRVFNADIEVKAVEALNVYSIFIKHYNNYIKNVNSLKLLCHRKSRGPMLVTLRFDDFITMLDELLTFRKPGG